MSNDLSSKTICVIDRGLFTSWAVKMTEYFGRVLYWSDWKDAFPSSNKFKVGTGLEGVERVENFFDIIKEVDVFASLDVYDGDLQCHLRELGYPVWGSAKGEELELDRWACKELLKDIGLPVQPVERIFGINELRAYLMENENKYVKISLLRGDFETFHHITYRLSEPLLDEIESKLGANKEDKEFIVEDAIDDALEVGYDGYTIDGQFPKTAIFGYEIKDVSYIGSIRPYAKLPEQVKEVNSKLAPVFSNYGYRGFWSSEIRIPKNKKAYFTDACCRCGSPPSELYQEMFSNWGEIIWGGAHGEVVEPKPVAKYGVEALIHCPWADLHPCAVYYPPEIEKWVKLRNWSKKEGISYVMPQTVGLPEIGAVVAVDNTILGAIKKLKSYADQLEGYTVNVKVNDISTAVDTVREGQSKGLQFSDESLPTPAQVAAAIA